MITGRELLAWLQAHPNQLDDPVHLLAQDDDAPSYLTAIEQDCFDENEGPVISLVSEHEKASEEPAGETKPRVPDPWSISIDPGRSTHLCIGQPGCYRVEWAQNASWAMFTKIDDELGHGQPVERQADSEAQR